MKCSKFPDHNQDTGMRYASPLHSQFMSFIYAKCLILVLGLLSAAVLTAFNANTDNIQYKTVENDFRFVQINLE